MSVACRQWNYTCCIFKLMVLVLRGRALIWPLDFLLFYSAILMYMFLLFTNLVNYFKFNWHAVRLYTMHLYFYFLAFITLSALLRLSNEDQQRKSLISFTSYWYMPVLHKLNINCIPCYCRPMTFTSEMFETKIKLK